LQPEYQYVWSPRYIDAAVLRDENTDADGLCDDERIYYLNDANFNVTALVDTGGDAIERYLYEPYGELTVMDGSFGARASSAYANPYTFTGRRFDQETKLYDYRNRLLAAQLGRFTGRDRTVLARGLRAYLYVNSNPVGWTDPRGLIARKKIDGPTYKPYGEFTVEWEFSLDDSYDDEVVLVQRIQVRLELEPCVHSGHLRPKSCKYNYFERVGYVDPNQKTPKDKEASVDTWHSSGFPRHSFQWHDPRRRGTFTCPTEGRLVMSGRIQAFRLTDRMRAVLDTWNPREQYRDRDRKCGGVIWTSGGFPSSERFVGRADKELLESEMVEENEVVQYLDVKWNCDGKNVIQNLGTRTE
jgi:RHS repeat-associated protein